MPCSGERWPGGAGGAGGGILPSAPPAWERSRQGRGAQPRGTAGKGRGAAELDARSSRKSAVATEMLPAPPPPPWPPPRGKLTRAAGREESEAVPGTPGGARGRREGKERKGREGQQTDRPGAQAGASGARRGGAIVPPHTEAPGAVLRPPLPSPGRSPGANLGWGGVGRERWVREARHPQLQAGTQRPTGARRSCAWEDFPAHCRGLHVASKAGPALCAPSLRELALEPWDAGRAAAPPASHAPGLSGPRPSSANSPGCFSACLQVPGNFFCLMER